MAEEYRNGYSRKVYSHRRQGRRSSPVPLFDQVFGMGKPVLRDYEQAIDLSVKKVRVETAETSKTGASKDHVKTKQMPIVSSSSNDEEEMLDLLSERSSFCSDANAEDISDRELSLIRAHMSNIESEDTRRSSQSLTVTFVLTSATDSGSPSTADSFQPVEMPRQSTNAPEIEVFSLANLSTDVVKEDEKGYESPQEVFDLSGSGLDGDEIRSSTPVNNSQIQLQLFDSLSTIAELQNNRDKDEEDEVKDAEIIADNEEGLEEDEEEELEEEDEEEEEESVSYATQNEKTPPRSNKHSACPSISLKHSLRNRKKDRSKKLRSSRCIFPEESMQEQVPVTQSLELTQQAKESLDCPVVMRQLTSTPMSCRGNNDYLPHPALSTITMVDPQDSSTAVEPNGEEARLEMSVPNDDQEKQDLVCKGICDHVAGHKQLTSTPVSFLKCKVDSCLPPAVSIIALCRPSLAECSSEGRLPWQSDCGRLAKRSRISSDETGLPEKLKSKSLLNLPVLNPPYMVEPDRWNIPYKTTAGQVCERNDLELCSIVRLPFVEDNPVRLLQCVVEKNAVTSCSPDFLESF